VTNPNNLPLQLTSFIGREREIAEVERLLATTRLLTLTGSGGCGKTRLALQVAAEMLDSFPNGVWFVDLAPLSDASLVSQAIADVFDLHQISETFDILLQNFLRSKNLLLVLDNCEHLIQACAQMCDTLLRACPSIKILATSREALGEAGETAYRVPSLAVADPSIYRRSNDVAVKQSACSRPCDFSPVHI
jgi:predicted ATPase